MDRRSTLKDRAPRRTGFRSARLHAAMSTDVADTHSTSSVRLRASSELDFLPAHGLTRRSPPRFALSDLLLPVDPSQRPPGRRAAR